MEMDSFPYTRNGTEINQVAQFRFIFRLPLTRLLLQPCDISFVFQASPQNVKNPQTLMFTGSPKLPELGSNQQPFG